MKILTVFIDGLKPESIEHMPFLTSFSENKRIKTELGYSVTCHASMYSGVYPNKHLRWFLWKKDLETSPSKWIKTFKIDKLPDNIYTKYGLYQLVKFFTKNNSYYDLPLFWEMPIKYWHYFDMTEKKFWNEPGFLEKYPTIFDILRNNNISFETVGLVKKGSESSSKIIDQFVFDEIKPWTYFFVGDVDPLSHRYGQDSIEMQKKLNEIDRIIEKKYQFYEKKCDDFTFLLFSDHGHIKIERTIDLKNIFRTSGESLENYIHFIDANYARFWFRSDHEKKRVIKILSDMDNKGFILTKEHLQKYNVDMPDNRYGDLIFYLDAPYIFDHSFIAMGRKIGGEEVSGHGYLPDYKDSDGVFISNKEIINKSYITLVDILPSILNVLKIPIMSYANGEILWK